MKENKECKIVKDLLPTYIEGLTSKETNEFIEKHFEECDNCKTIYENMKSDIDIENGKASDDEINYMRKYKKKLVLTVVKTIGVIAFAMIYVYVVQVISRFDILNDIEKKYSKSSESTNYYIKQEKYPSKEDVGMKIQVWKKGSIYKYQVFDNQFFWGDLSTGECYVFEEYNGKKTYGDISNDKNAIEFYSNIRFGPNLPVTGYDGEFWIKLSYAMDLSNSIKKGFVQSLNEPCYVIDSDGLNGQKTYIQMETGLPLAVTGGINENYGTIEYEYRFDSLTDEEMAKPNLSEYEFVPRK